MKSSNLFFFCVVCASALTGVEPLPPVQEFDHLNPPQGMFIDEWTEIYLNREKVGYAHTQMWREGDIIHTQEESNLRIARAGNPVEMTVRQRVEETVDGKPLKIETYSLLGKVPIEMSASIVGDVMRLTFQQDGREKVQDYPFPPGTLLVWGMARESFIRGFEPGNQYTLKLYSPDMVMHTPVNADLEVVARDKLDYYGTLLDAVRVKTRLYLGSLEIITISWVDDYGRSIKSSMAMGGMPMDIYLVSRDQAMSEFETSEVFNTSLIELNRSIPRDARRVIYRIVRKDGNPFNMALPHTALQLVDDDGSGKTLTVISQKHYDPPDHVSSRIEEGIYLKSTPMMDLLDERLIELYQKASKGKHSSDIKMARRLTKFVSEFITDKNLATGFATASEVSRYAEGDCTEHAILLAALGRLAGIPSRVAAGLAFVPWVGQQENVMGYHMWTQFYINGAWIDYDASIYEKKGVTPRRIALAVSAVENPFLGDIGLPLLELFGNLKIEILSITE